MDRPRRAVDRFKEVHGLGGLRPGPIHATFNTALHSDCFSFDKEMKKGIERLIFERPSGMQRSMYTKALRWKCEPQRSFRDDSGILATERDYLDKL